jgi:putative DNA primase/helicase
VSVAHLDRTPDPAADFLAELYGSAEDGWLTLFAINPASGDRHVDWTPAVDATALAVTAAKRAGTCDVWFGVATRRQPLGARRGGDSDCHALPGLWVDIDIAGANHKTDAAVLPPDEGAAVELLASFALPPTVVVHTGGGLHAYWLFGEMLPAADVAALLPRWGATWQRLAGERGWHIDNVWDLARVLRLPGTWNRKGDPTPVSILERWAT